MNSIAKSFLLLNINLAIAVKVLSNLTLSRITVILTFTLIKLMLLPQYQMEEIKLYWQIGQMTNI